MDKIPVRHISHDKEPRPPEFISIRKISVLQTGKDMVQPLHRHDFFYLLLLKKGEGTHEIDFNSYPVKNNTIFFLRPGQVHQLLLKAGSTGYLVQFKHEFYPSPVGASTDLLRQASSNNFYDFTSGSFQKVYTLLTYAHQEYEGRKKDYEAAIKANLDLVFIELSRKASNKPTDSTSLYMQERLESFLSLLEPEPNMFSQRTSSHYAASLNLSTYQLNNTTKTLLGKTVSELIDDRIILEAKRYLLATSDQITQIADHLGYEDVSYFVRFFKKHTGSSPEAFRKKKSI